jgi:predicted regulator of Ras-like GTPase activity (Roadblock/LC7/MglB family)
MPFNYLLTNLLVDVPQAVGAIFVDPEGEAVEWVTRHDDPFDLKVEGAYHSIFMRQLEEMASSAHAGTVSSLVLEGTRLVTLTQALPRGYYVVLVVDRSGSRAHALHRLRRAAEVIAEEIV